jgi:hypothetical protein
MQAPPPPAILFGPPAQIVVAAARPPCVVVAAIAIDPAQPIAAAQHQTFLIALRATMDGGYSWTPRPRPSSNAIVRLERDIDISDVAYNNLDRTGRRAVMVGGEATQFFVFDVVGAGQAKIVFDLRGPGAIHGPPTQTKTFTLNAQNKTAVCE